MLTNEWRASLVTNRINFTTATWVPNRFLSREMVAWLRYKFDCVKDGPLETTRSPSIILIFDLRCHSLLNICLLHLIHHDYQGSQISFISFMQSTYPGESGIAQTSRSIVGTKGGFRFWRFDAQTSRFRMMLVVLHCLLESKHQFVQENSWPFVILAKFLWRILERNTLWMTALNF